MTQFFQKISKHYMNQTTCTCKLGAELGLGTTWFKGLSCQSYGFSSSFEL